jgi:hypothetical protein
MTRTHFNRAEEKLSSARELLDIDTPDIRGQLRLALLGLAGLAPPHPPALPPELQAEFDRIWAACTRKDGPDGAISATIAAMDAAEASLWAAAIVALAGQVERLVE